ncbi:MAG TPA: RsmD family RNA methyltransferase [Gemmatimonadaceae bacterium]|jgi:16S rRNA (guanine966-N2)-methyltransferase
MRIVGGKWAGKDLTSPNDFRVHPTAEKVRAATLDLLKGDLKDARVLDLFAGTGALGLEALSRGAKSADFVETRPASLHALKANVAVLRARDNSRVFKRDALPFAAAITTAGAYDICFCDPPYESRMLDKVIESWQATYFARVFVAEHAATHKLPPGGRRYDYGASAITIYRAP